MPHFAECIVFNGLNSISFRTAAKAAVARADENRGAADFGKTIPRASGFGKKLSAFCRAPLPVGEP